MNFAKFSVRLAQSGMVGVMLMTGLAWGANDCKGTSPCANETEAPVNSFGGAATALTDNCDGTTPCFSKVGDYLNGKRKLLPDDDLLYLLAREPDRGFPYSSLNTLLSKDLNFTASQQRIEPATKCALLRGPYRARLFNTDNDWVVAIKGQPEADDLCSLQGLDSGLLTVQDSRIPQTVLTQPIVAASGGAAQFEITIGDVNQDGYDDIVVAKGDGIDIFTAVDTQDPSKGLRKAAAFAVAAANPGYVYQHGGLVIGDFNHDGATDLIAEYVGPISYQRVPVAMYGFSVCPAAGFVLYSGSTDPAYPPYTCTAAFEIFRHADGLLDRNAFGQISGPDFYKNSDPARLVAGDFLGRNDGTVELFADIPQCHADSEHNCVRKYDYVRLFQIWAFDAQLRPKKLNELRVNSGVEVGYAERIKRTDFMRAARLHWSGVGSDRDQVVLFADQHPSNSTLQIINFDDSGTITGGPRLNVAIHGEHVVGMDVGRFDPPNSTPSTPTFDRQVSLLITNDPGGTEIHTYSATDTWALRRESYQNLGTWHKFLGYGSFDDLDGMMHTVDAQGRGLLLGAPIKVTISSHIQPDLVLGIPPMHIDYIKNAAGDGPAVLNLTVLPSTPSNNQPAFRTRFAFTSEASNKRKESSTTDSALAVGAEGSVDLRLGPKKASNLKIEFEASIKQSWGTSRETESAKYGSTTSSLEATTGFADHLFLKEFRQNVYYYPVIGKRCPNGSAPPNCKPEDLEQQWVQYSAPDKIENLELDATTQQWYQPPQEPGNIFSYPWNLGQTNFAFPRFASLAKETWKLTDTSNTTVSSDWKSGSSSGETTGSVNKYSFDSSLSVSGTVGSEKSSSLTVGIKLNYGNSRSIEAETTDTSTFDNSTGIKTDKPPFPDDIATKYFYYYSSYIFGQTPLADSISAPVLTSPDGVAVGQQFFGPLIVAYAADPFHAAAQAPWWRRTYKMPDIGLNHPSRWSWDRENKIASFNHHEPLTTPLNPETILSDVFYHMKGLFIGQASDDPNNSPMISVATAGDKLRLRARIYNFSIADMPDGSSVHVRFYGQEYKDASLVGDSFLIGEDTLSAISGFNSNSNQGELPNWKFASTTFETTQYSGKFLVFWVVAWGEDADGNMLEEQEGHGLKENPANLTFKQITDVPVDDYSNNVGMYGTYTPFFVAPKHSAGSLGNATPPGDTRWLQANDVLVEAKPANRNQRSWVKVTVHNTTGGDLIEEPVTLFDGDPANGGRAFDFQMIPFVAAGDTYSLRTFLIPETCGNHDIVVRVGNQDESEKLAMKTLTVQ